MVIGGGITGCGIALDAQSRGLKTALIDKGDFASGTSSKSSKLVHGGLRYLEQHEFRLVYESLHERQRLLKNAPHLVEPQPFLIPLFGKGGIADRTIARTYATALWIYDLTGGLRIGKRHKRISKAEASAHLPTLRTEKLAAGFIYYDARVDDARLTLTVAKTAALKYGACVANYVKATNFIKDSNGKITNVAIAGDAIDEGSSISCRWVVNATGVWADELRTIDEGVPEHSIRPAKGIHITVPFDKLPCDIAAVIPVRQDHRSIFIIPWAWGNQTYIGTTDTDYSGPLDDPECTSEDVEYLLNAVNSFVSDPISPSDVIGIWAGLRPLVSSGPKSKRSRTADLSRRHHISVSPSNLLTITGGKLTTYRQMAQDCVDEVLVSIDRPKIKCQTKQLKLIGSESYDLAQLEKQANQLNLSSEMIGILKRRYGAQAIEVIKLCESDPSLANQLISGANYLKAEVVYGIRFEMAQTIEDIVARRTRALLVEQPNLLESIDEISQLIAQELGWDEPTRQMELKNFVEGARRRSEHAGLLI